MKVRKATLVVTLLIGCFTLAGCSNNEFNVSMNSNPYDPIFVDYKGTKEVEKIGVISTIDDTEHVAE